MLQHDAEVALKLADLIAEDAELPMQKKRDLAKYLYDIAEEAAAKTEEDEIKEQRYVAVKGERGEVTLYIGTSNAELDDVQRAAIKEVFLQTKERLRNIMQ